MLSQFTYIINQKESFDIKLLHGGFSTVPTQQVSFQHLDRHVLSIVINGKCTYTINNRSFEVGKGDVVFIPSGTVYSTQTTDKTFRHYFVAFVGTNCLSLAAHAGLTIEHPYVHTQDDFIQRTMKRIFKLMAANSYSSIMKANILFCEIFYRLFVLIPENNVSQKALPRSFVQQAEEFIRTHYSSDISVYDISQALHISRTYLSAIFKKDKGVTLQTYLTTHRILQSYNLLINTDLSILEIATSVGFNNSVSYYRQFKSLSGFSPKQYRQVYRREIESKTFSINTEKKDERK